MSSNATTNQTRLLWFMSMVVLSSCAGVEAVRLAASGSRTTVARPALYPETLVYSQSRDTFLVSSLREGGVFEVDRQGRTRSLVDDVRLSSVLGIALDEERGRLWVVNADLGASQKPSKEGARKLAGVGLYDLATGRSLHYVDLAPLVPGPHLLNGITVDAGGNAYATDSLSPNIYKIDAQGHASVFVHDERFLGPGINLNGIVHHGDGYLLAVKKSDGTLFKIPLRHPAQLTKVVTDHTFEGGDGLLLVGGRSLLVVANQTGTATSNTAFVISSDDGWATAKVVDQRALGAVYPTTAARRDGKVYVLHSKLNELIEGAPEVKASLQMSATIEEIGSIVRSRQAPVRPPVP